MIVAVLLSTVRLLLGCGARLGSDSDLESEVPGGASRSIFSSRRESATRSLPPLPDDLKPAETTEEGPESQVILVENWFEELKRRVPTD